MKNFKDLCVDLDNFFETNKDNIRINQYQSYLGLKDAIGNKYDELSADKVKEFTLLCVEKSGNEIDLYDYSSAIATAIYIDNVITLDEIKSVPSDYIIDCYRDERIYRVGDYKEDFEIEHDNF